MTFQLAFILVKNSEFGPSSVKNGDYKVLERSKDTPVPKSDFLLLSKSK